MIRLAALVLSLAGFAAAQAGGPVTPYGSPTPGSGGIAPRAWIDGEPRLGNAGFRLLVDDGLAGAPAALLLSDAPARLALAGIEVLVNIASPFFVVVPPVLLGGAPAGTHGGGSASALLPIPAVPALSGLSLFGQWVIADPAGSAALAATDGLHMTIRGDPLFFAAGLTGLRTLDPTGATTSQPFSQVGFGIHAELTRAGTELCVALHHPLLGSWLAIYDAKVQPPVELCACPIPTPSGVMIHPTANEAYILTNRAFSSTAIWMGIVVYDVDPGSGTFGQQVASISGLRRTTAFSTAMSADGRRLVVADASVMAVVDVEPGSPTRHQVLRTIPRGAFFTRTFVAPDGETACLAHNLGPFIQRVDLHTGAELQRFTTPAPVTDGEMDRRGRFFVVSYGVPYVSVLDLEPGPGLFTERRIPTSGPATGVALSADGATVIVSTATTFEAYVVATGVRFWSVPSAGSTNELVLR